MDLCETTIVLKILLILKSLINIVKIVIPLILIVIIIIDVTKNILDPDKQKKVLEISIKRFISAIIIFFVPSIVNGVFNGIGKNSPILACFNNATAEYISEKVEEERLLKEKAEKELTEEYERQAKEIEEERKRQEEELKKREEEQQKQEVLTEIELIDSNYPPRYYINGSNEERKNITVNYFKGDKEFTYWMYTPETITTNLPLIVFIHGHGSSHGNDYILGDKALRNANGILYGPIRDAINSSNISYNAIVIQPQIPYTYKNGQKVDLGGYDYVSSYIQLINQIKKVYKINDNKISMMGVSHGCYVTIYFINKYPDYLSAAVPLACNPYNKDFALDYGNYSNYTKTPIWAFVGSSGEGARSSQMPKFVNSVTAAGGNAKYNYIPNSCHNVVHCDNDYNLLKDDNYNILNWMLSQTRSN